MSTEPLSFTYDAAQFARGQIAPLCEGTQKLFKPLRLSEGDRLEIDLNKSGEDFLCETTSIGWDGQVQRLSSSSADWEFWQRLPEQHKLSPESREHIVAATDFNVVVINALWPENQIVFRSMEAHQRFILLLMRFLQQTEVMVARAKFKTTGELPNSPAQFFDHPTFPLKAHQLAAHHTTVFQSASALFMEQGTGKTPVVIRRICHEAWFSKKLLRVLVICPKHIRQNWSNEIKRFATLNGKVSVLRGDLISRIKILTESLKPTVGSESEAQRDRYSVVIASYAAITRTPIIQAMPWGICVLDESHNGKNAATERTKALLRLRDNCAKRIILTGTPITNSPTDLFTQLEFLGKGLSGFKTYKGFKKFYLKYKPQMPGVKKRDIVAGYNNLPVMQERLARLAFMVTKREALPNLPPKSYIQLEAGLGTRQAEIYNRVREEIAIEIEDELAGATASTQKLAIENALTRLLRLAQITAGMVQYDAVYDPLTGEEICEGKVEFFVDNPKLDLLEQQISELDPSEKFIVWCCFKPLLPVIAKRLERFGVRIIHGSLSDATRQNAEYEFNCNPNIRGIVANQGAVKEGCNLLGYDWSNTTLRDGEIPDTYCGKEFYYAQNWSMVTRTQSEDRCHRIGTATPTPVEVIDVLVPGSIDEEIRARVTRMRDTAATIQDVRQVLRNVLNTNPVGD